MAVVGVGVVVVVVVVVALGGGVGLAAFVVAAVAVPVGVVVVVVGWVVSGHVGDVLLSRALGLERGGSSAWVGFRAHLL